MFTERAQKIQHFRIRLLLQDNPDDNRIANIGQFRDLAVDVVFKELKASMPTPGTPVYEMGPSTGNYRLLGQFQGFYVSQSVGRP